MCRLLQLLLVVLLAGCTTVSQEQQAKSEPTLMPEQFFTGKLSAYGVLKDWRGRQTRHFEADIDACWEAGVGTLEEHFVFDDGELQQRVWRLVPEGEGSYRASANDVVGTTILSAVGNTLQMQYDLEIPWGDSTLVLTVDDTMYLVTDQVLINTSIMSKWGVPVGEIVLTILRRPEMDGSCQPG